MRPDDEDRRGRAESVGALLREAGVDDPPVARTGGAHDQTALLEPVDQPRHPALAEPQRLADVDHPQAALGSAGQQHEQLDLVGRESGARLEQRARGRRARDRSPG